MPLILSLFFIIWPFGSLPLILYLMYHQKKYSYHFLGILVSLFVMYYPPAGDQYRYWLDFQEAMPLIDTINSILSSNSVKKFSLIHPILSTFREMGSNLEHIRFTLILISYYLCTNLFFSTTENYKKTVAKKTYFFAFLVFFASIPVYAIMTGFRWGMATVLFFLAINNFFRSNRISGGIYALFSCLFHFAIVPMFLLYLLFSLTQRIIWKYPVVLLSAAIITSLSLDFLITYLLKFTFFDFVSPYLAPEGIWRTGAIPYKISLLAQISTLIFNFLFYIFLTVILIFIYRYKKEENESSTYLTALLTFAFMLIVVFLILRDFYTISGRIKSLVVIFSTYPIILSKLQNKISLSPQLYRLASFFVVFSFIFLFLSLKKPLSAGGIDRFCYSSSYTIFCNTYSENWVLNNVNEDGGIIKK